MRQMIEVGGPGIAAALAEQPVTKAEYRSFIRATRKSALPPLTPGERLCDPVTCVSQDDAAAYCAWAAGQGGRAYRLPKIAELTALAGDAAAEGISSEVWPHYYQQRPELSGGMQPTYLCEWTLERDCLQQAGSWTRVLGSVFFPPWLRHGPNASHLQACLLASDGYSFVTFRLAVDL